MMKKLFRAALSATFALTCVSCAEFDKPKYKLSVHVEGASEDNPRELIPLPMGDRKFLFKRVPEFSHRQISAFEPFPADDGQGNGLLLQLDVSGRNALEAATRMRQGELMLTVVNGVPVDIVQTDKPVADGRFTVWRGVSDETIVEMDKKLPRISQLRSSSRHMDMLASTDKEKEDVRRDAKELEAHMKKMEKNEGKPGGATSWFKAPQSKEIPLE